MTGVARTYDEYRCLFVFVFLGVEVFFFLFFECAFSFLLVFLLVLGSLGGRCCFLLD